jgi:hypothetical protein
MAEARVIRLSNKSVAALQLQDEQAMLMGNDKNFIVCNKQGITLRGPISFISDSMSRRHAGLFVGISDFQEMIPQTLVTPVPSAIPMPPAFAIVNIVKDLAFFTALLV